MKSLYRVLGSVLAKAAAAALILQPAIGLGQVSDTQATETADDAYDKIEAITVFGRVRGETLRDIPQGVTVFDQETLEIAPVVTVGDVVRFVPTASRDGSTLNPFGDTYLIRGFYASQTINGLGHNRIAHARDAANVERIEVLKGPASVLYGQMEPGAVINVVTKQPLDHFQGEVGVEYGRYNDQRITVDVTGPITDRVSGRFIVSHHDTESFIDFWDLEHLFVAPNLTVDFSPSTTLTIEGIYSTNDWGSSQNGTPAQGLYLPNPVGQYDRSFNPDEPGANGGFTERDSVDANVRLLHEFNDSLRVRASYTYTRNEAEFAEMFVLGLDDDFRTLTRAMFFGKDAVENDDNFLVDLAGEFTTGTIDHRVLLGFGHRQFDGNRPTRFVLSSSLDLFEPVYGLAPDLVPAYNRSFQDFDATSFFVQDRVTIGERLHLLAGVRYTDASQDTIFIGAGSDEPSPDSMDEENWSTQFGILYDITSQFAIYANRAESFVPQFGTSSGGTPFDAEVGTQYEIGTRFMLGGLQTSAALFSITKENMPTTDPQNPGFEAPLGEVESRGFELTLYGDVRPNWLLGVAYGYLDTEISKNFDGLSGNVLRNTPENTFSLLTRYDITSGPLDGLGLGATLEHVDSRYGDDDNTFKLPAHTRLDLAAYYPISERVQLDVMVNNVFDEDIYAEGFSITAVIPEPGLTYLARLKFTWD